MLELNLSELMVDLHGYDVLVDYCLIHSLPMPDVLTTPFWPNHMPDSSSGAVSTMFSCAFATGPVVGLSSSGRLKAYTSTLVDWRRGPSRTGHYRRSYR